MHWNSWKRFGNVSAWQMYGRTWLIIDLQTLVTPSNRSARGWTLCGVLFWAPFGCRLMLDWICFGYRTMAKRNVAAVLMVAKNRRCSLGFVIPVEPIHSWIGYFCVARSKPMYMYSDECPCASGRFICLSLPRNHGSVWRDGLDMCWKNRSQHKHVLQKHHLVKTKS